MDSPFQLLSVKKEIMKLMEEIFFSFTFGGETLSLAAALATMTKLQNEPVIQTMIKNGEEILTTIQSLIEKHGLEDIFIISGHPTWTFLTIKDTPDYTQFEIKTFYMQEMFKRGILTLGTHNISYAHSKEDLEQLFTAYDEMFLLLASYMSSKTLLEHIDSEPLEPLFKVR